MPTKGRKPQLQSFTDLTTLERLLDVGQSLISERNLPSLLQTIVKTAGDVLGADVIVLYEYREETDDVSIPPVVWGKLKHPSILKIRGLGRAHRNSPVFKVLRMSKPVYAPNAKEDWAKAIGGGALGKGKAKGFIERESIVSSAAMCLIANKKRVGVLFVYYRTPRIFHAEEQRIIELFATQAAIAIHNADLFTQERQRAADMYLLRRVSATISASLDIKKSLVLIAKGAVQLTRTEGTGVIHLFNEAGQGISDSYEFPEGFGLISSRYSEKKGLTWGVFKTGQIVEIADVSKSKRVSQALADSKTKSVIGVPLKLKGRIIGALFLNSFKQHKFTDDEKVILTLLAEQAVIALQNARRLQQEYTLRQQAERLSKVSSAISSNLDLEKVAGRILDELSKVVAYRKASMQLIQGDARQMLAHRGFGVETIDRWLLRPISQDRLISRVVSSKVPLILSVPSQDPDWEARSETADVRSWVGLPLVYGKETIGLLTLDHDQQGFYTPASERLLVSFANQAAVAINNARLVQRLRVRADQISLLQQIGARINSAMKLEKILRLLVEGAIRLTSTTSGVVDTFNSSYGEAIGSYGYPAKFDHPSPRILARGYTSLIIQTKEQQVVQDAQIDERVNPDIIKKGVRSFVGTPLKLAGERVVGVLYVNDTSVRQFTEEELSLLRALADQAAIAIENASLLEETTQRAAGIAFANRLGRALSATRDIEEIPRLLVKGVLSAFNAEACFLALINTETQEIEFQFALDYKGTGKLDEVMKGFKIPLHKGIAGTVVQSRTAVISNNVRDDPRWDREVDSVTGFTAKSILAVPLVYGDRAIGVIEILNKRDGSLFLERERDVLATLALSAAIAIENARLYAQRAKDIIALEEINAAITTESRENISALITRKAKELTQADYSGLWLVDENHLVLGSMYGASPMAAPELLIDGESIPGWVAETGKPYKCFDVNTDPHYRMWREEIQSSAAVPLKLGAKVTGTLGIESTRPNAFSNYQLKLLQSLADQAAIAIENARLFKETDERATQLEQLQEITRAISAESTDVEKVLRLIVESLSNMFGGASCAIRLFDSSQAEFGRWVGAGAFKDRWDHAPRPEGTSWHVVNNKIPLYVEDTSATPPTGQPGVRKEAIDRGVRAIAYLPLVSKGMSIGILYVNLDAPHRFSENEQRVLGLFADQAAIAIENARLHEQRSRDITALQELNEAVISKRLDEILELVVGKAVEVMPGEYSELWLKEPDTGDLVLAAVCGPGEEAAQKVGRLKAGVASINMQAAETGKSYIGEDATKEPSLYKIYRAAQSSVTVPLKYQDNVIGTLNVESSRPRVFTEQHSRLLSSFADQAAIAIENARLYQSLQQRVRDLTVEHHFNPYVVGEPIRDPQSFFGRRQLIQDIMDVIHDNNIIVYGERRIGKTSLLFQLEYYLRDFSNQDEPYFFLPVLASLEGISEDRFFAFLMTQVARATQIPQDRLAHQEGETGYDHQDFEDDLETIIPFLQEQHSSKQIRVVLLLDEMDQFVGYDPTIHGRFRSLFTSRIGAHLKMIMAGVSVQRVQQARTSPWYNLFKEMELRPLDKNAAQQLVVEPVQGYYTYDDEALRTLLDYSDLKPQEIQRLASLAVKVMLERVSDATRTAKRPVRPNDLVILKEDILQVQDLAVAEKDGEYRDWWNSLSNIQRQALLDALGREDLLGTTANFADSGSVFSREDLYNVTYLDHQHVRLTHLFSHWLRRVH